MEKQKMLEMLSVWKNHYLEINVINNKFYDLFGESAPEVFWKSFDLYTEMLSKLLGDDTDDNWLDWFCYENNMGERAMDAGYDGNIKKITTLDDLADLLIEQGKRT